MSVTKGNNRNYGFDLMRILLMAMVITLHYLYHGEILSSVEYGSLEYYFFWLIRAISYPCVNCYVLLSGFYLCENSRHNISKLFRLEYQTLFFCVICSILSVAVFHCTINKQLLINTFFPVTSGSYWFVTSYMLMYAFSPYFNAVLGKLDKSKHITLIVLLVIITSVIPTFLYWSRSVFSGGRDFPWFVTLYCIASYIKKYNISLSQKKGWIYYILSTALMLASLVLIGIVTNAVYNNVKEVDYFYRMNSLIVLIQSISLFMMFREAKVVCNKLLISISAISRYVFGAYLLHENPVFRPFLWKFFAPTKALDSSSPVIYGALYGLFIVIILIFFGIILDCIREYTYSIFRFSKIEIMLHRLDKRFEIE